MCNSAPLNNGLTCQLMHFYEKYPAAQPEKYTTYGTAMRSSL
jgi:hypothetical protein